ncbi:hypothetical protein JY97_13085 [Alkalispirochaeta odontotermitis]|nr:hypothetical protein JY97_13085 [Alkalispirochaeta odontotermitis]CAB1077066.1 hypothetical protein D1AOALGA4SA_4862 [Olavius algarvensis Delta 1 endosymbiont]
MLANLLTFLNTSFSIFIVLINLQTVDISAVFELAEQQPGYNLGIQGLRNSGIKIGLFSYFNSSIPKTLNP